MHHIRPWYLDGETELDNLVSLCGFHHHLVHEGGWTVRLLDDTNVEWFDASGVRAPVDLLPAGSPSDLPAGDHAGMVGPAPRRMSRSQSMSSPMRSCGPVTKTSPRGRLGYVRPMTETPWTGDVVGLVEAFRAGERSPTEELEATFAAIEASELNAVCHVDADAARAAAATADVSLPYGGVPLAVKELLAVGGWPASQGSLALADQVFERDGISVERLKAAGAVAAVQTTSSEFGATNQTTTKIHGATRNPWHLDRTPGGSSGGSAAGVAGGLFALATASDGGGSIRIPAGFCGLIGLKSTFGPHPPGTGSHPRQRHLGRRHRQPQRARRGPVPRCHQRVRRPRPTLPPRGWRGTRPDSDPSPMRSVRCGWRSSPI